MGYGKGADDVGGFGLFCGGLFVDCVDVCVSLCFVLYV